jgi:hypothetical protein
VEYIHRQEHLETPQPTATPHKSRYATGGRCVARKELQGREYPYLQTKGETLIWVLAKDA